MGSETQYSGFDSDIKSKTLVTYQAISRSGPPSSYDENQFLRFMFANADHMLYSK